MPPLSGGWMLTSALISSAVTNFRVSQPMPKDIAMPPALLRAAPEIGSATQRGLPVLHCSCIEDHSFGVAPPAVDEARGPVFAQNTRRDKPCPHPPPSPTRPPAP